MGYYVKVNPKVAEALHRTQRRKTPDGNYVLWMGDLSLLGPARDRAAIVKRIGGVWLDGNQLYDEQNGTVCHELPEPEEERFRMTPAEPSGSETSTEVPAPEAPEDGTPALSSGTQSTGPEPESEDGNADFPLDRAEHNMEGGEE